MQPKVGPQYWYLYVYELFHYTFSLYYIYGGHTDNPKTFGTDFTLLEDII